MPLGVALRLFFENGGQRAIVVRVLPQPGRSLLDDDLIPTAGIESERGVYALAKADLFNLLVIPPLDWYREIAPSTWAAVAAFCLARRAILIVDAPPIAGADPIAEATAARDSVIAAMSSSPFAAANAAFYVPRVMAEVAGCEQDVAASGAVAGVIARTDGSRSVWTTPAGMNATLHGVTGLSTTLTSWENDALNQQGVNCLRAFPGREPVIWGARTLRGSDTAASEWKYVPVRRLALLIEESLDRGTRWAMFEPNDESLWSRLRLSVGTFLLDLFQQGAFQGRTPSDGFFVKCDSTTTTQGDIDNGRVNIHVGFAAVRPAEFVILHIQQLAGARTTTAP
jgi:phage tail sheath protein FI